MKTALFALLAVILLLSFISFSKIQAQTGVAFAVAPVPQISTAIVVSLGNGNANTIADVAVSDMNGNVLIHQSYGAGVAAATVDYSTLSPNIYVITVSSNTVAQSQILGVNFPVCPPYCP